MKVPVGREAPGEIKGGNSLMKTPVRTRLLSALLSLVMLVSLLPVSVFAAEPASGTWEKVTEAQEDWSGQYLIVYEKGSLIMDGSLSALDKEGNKVDVTITDGKIGRTATRWWCSTPPTRRLCPPCTTASITQAWMWS